MTTKTALQEIFKGDSLNGKERPKATKTRKKQKISRINDQTINKIALNPYLSIIILTVNEIHALIKRHRALGHLGGSAG